MSNSPGDAEYFRSFANLTFEDFRERAKNQSLSANEKIGFPDFPLLVVTMMTPLDARDP